MTTYEINPIDADGDHLLPCPREATSKKEARAIAKEMAAQPRSFWVQKAESETWPDQIESIAIFADGELIDELTPAFKD